MTFHFFEIMGQKRALIQQGTWFSQVTIGKMETQHLENHKQWLFRWFSPEKAKVHRSKETNKMVIIVASDEYNGTWNAGLRRMNTLPV